MKLSEIAGDQPLIVSLIVKAIKDAEKNDGAVLLFDPALKDHHRVEVLSARWNTEAIGWLTLTILLDPRTAVPIHTSYLADVMENLSLKKVGKDWHLTYTPVTGL